MSPAKPTIPRAYKRGYEVNGTQPIVISPREGQLYEHSLKNHLHFQCYGGKILTNQSKWIINFIDPSGQGEIPYRR